MNKELIKRLEEIFEQKMSKKTGWGKNEIMIEFKNSVNEVVLEALDKYENPKTAKLEWADDIGSNFTDLKNKTL